ATWRRRWKIPMNYLCEESPLITWVLRRADVAGCPAHFLQDKMVRMYRLHKKPIFLPNIEDIPPSLPQKNTQPTVCFVGRFDKRKRPELCIKLAGQFPQVQFLMVGQAEDRAQQQKLEASAARFNNIRMLGYVDKFDSDTLSKVYDVSWMLL